MESSNLIILDGGCDAQKQIYWIGCKCCGSAHIKIIERIKFETDRFEIQLQGETQRFQRFVHALNYAKTLIENRRLNSELLEIAPPEEA